MPKGLIKKTDVPDKCGLMTFNGERWRTVKKPTIQPVEIPQETFLKLLITGIDEEGNKHLRLAHYNARAYRKLERAHAVASKKFGHEIARQLQEADYAKKQLQYFNQQNEKQQAIQIEITKANCDEIRKQLPKLWSDLCEMLNVKQPTSPFCVRRAIENLRNQTQGSAEERLLNRIVRDMRSHVHTFDHLKQQAREKKEDVNNLP